MTETTPPLRNPAINIYSHDVMRLVGFYQRLGFRETFRTPRQGVPVHVELTLDHFTIGIASSTQRSPTTASTPTSADGRSSSSSGPTTPTATTNA